MSYNSFESIAHTFWANFAGMHILYQVAIIAITVFLVIMSLTFAYNMVHLAFTFTKDMVMMVVELVEKLIRDLDKTMQKLFGTQAFMPPKKKVEQSA